MDELVDSPALTLGFFLLTTDFVFVLLNAVLWARSLVKGVQSTDQRADKRIEPPSAGCA